VTLTRSFLITQTEVTQAMWTKHRIVNPSMELPNSEGDCLEPECPVGHVTWFEAARFANEVSQHQGYAPCYELSGCTGRLGKGMTCTGVSLSAPTVYDCPGFRLPTEAEWEYAARGGVEGLKYPWGNDRSHDQANYWRTGGQDQWQYTAPVGSFPPNAFGLYDMAGNVYEWVADWFSETYYAASPAADPPGPPGGRLRVARGGAGFLNPAVLRISTRVRSAPDTRNVSVGLRCAADAIQ
jgi:formylglycine-generating enzyme required for sulfatase activity